MKPWDIPAEELPNTPTDQLFLHFIQSPMVTYLGVHTKDGVQRLLNASKTLKEFYERDDICDGVLRMYDAYVLDPDLVDSEAIISRSLSRVEANPLAASFVADPKNRNGLVLAKISMPLYWAEWIMRSPPFFEKTRGYENRFLRAYVERFDRITELSKKHDYDGYAPALSVRTNCVKLAERVNGRLYAELKDILPSQERENFREKFFGKIREYLNSIDGEEGG